MKKIEQIIFISILGLMLAGVMVALHIFGVAK